MYTGGVDISPFNIYIYIYGVLIAKLWMDTGTCGSIKRGEQITQDQSWVVFGQCVPFCTQTCSYPLPSFTPSREKERCQCFIKQYTFSHPTNEYPMITAQDPRYAFI